MWVRLQCSVCPIPATVDYDVANSLQDIRYHITNVERKKLCINVVYSVRTQSNGCFACSEHPGAGVAVEIGQRSTRYASLLIGRTGKGRKLSNNTRM
jgi:hypothetical protein